MITYDPDAGTCGTETTVAPVAPAARPTGAEPAFTG